MPSQKTIIELIARGGLVSAGQLAEAVEHHKEKGVKVVDALFSLGHLDPQALEEFLSKQSGVPSIELRNYQLSSDLMTVIPRDFALENEVVPIDRMANVLTVGMACPLDKEAIAELERLTELAVRPVLCSADDIWAVVSAYYCPEEPGGDPSPKEPPVGVGLKLEKLRKTIRAVDELPSLPRAVQAVQEALDSDDVSVAEVADIIQQDPPIAAKLLSVANSAGVAAAHEIDSVQRAAALLGLREIYALTVSVAVLNLGPEGKHFDYQDFWENSRYCAKAAAAIAKACNMENVAMVRTAALLHDLGRMVLGLISDDRYAGIGTALAGEALVNAETGEFGVGHPEAGHLLAESWNLPEEFDIAIRYHHDLARAPRMKELVAAVELADALYSTRHLEQEPAERFASETEALACLGLTAERLAEIETSIAGDA